MPSPSEMPAAEEGDAAVERAGGEDDRDERARGEDEEDHARAAVEGPGQARADLVGPEVLDAVQAVDGGAEQVVQAVGEALRPPGPVVGGGDGRAVVVAAVPARRDEERQRPDRDGDQRRDRQRAGEDELLRWRRLLLLGPALSIGQGCPADRAGPAASMA